MQGTPSPCVRAMSRPFHFRYLLAATLCVNAILTPAYAGIEVFTVATEPMTSVPDDAVVVELDAPARLDGALSMDLPTDPDAAAQAAQARMRSEDWQHVFKEYGRAYEAVARAWQLGIEKLPAVVVDGTYVVYGVHDVAQALQRIKQARENRP
ncbi:hypothetical protein B5T_02112 [Alloalcanivorax dieselolei B5]|jgi:integrating conjugative element protein (TIGR03757 family)|uniref:Integrating conjugative element protein, PFL_4709 family n=1 Tax=Alcanivorax dieselolei (strain DSM 16502 / CGMCC 1.3690 / MCCC 1A00001 / B-5) TaxID=930169 RepID=K0CFK9_ALCDB|nr:hypothetical protein B5T_02112 [Alloalcanivorax dieselolei B5]GGJ83874.1 hypothetical protein GCM10007426_11200 [Alloalcanivorax dieselolei]CUR46894.1 hypothetical protein BN2364_2453 [Alloalcanivorax xenomutans]